MPFKLRKSSRWCIHFLDSTRFGRIKDRLVGRGTDSEEVIRQRIERAKEEIALMREYDYAVVNDEVPLAAERVKRIIEAEHFRVDRVLVVTMT